MYSKSNNAWCEASVIRTDEEGGTLQVEYKTKAGAIMQKVLEDDSQDLRKPKRAAAAGSGWKPPPTLQGDLSPWRASKSDRDNVELRQELVAMTMRELKSRASGDKARGIKPIPWREWGHVLDGHNPKEELIEIILKHHDHGAVRSDDGALEPTTSKKVDDWDGRRVGMMQDDSGGDIWGDAPEPEPEPEDTSTYLPQRVTFSSSEWDGRTAYYCFKYYGPDGREQVMFRKRYSEFEALKSELGDAVKLPPFPPKKMSLLWNSASTVRSREEGLTAWLNAALESALDSDMPAPVAFVDQLRRFLVEMRESGDSRGNYPLLVVLWSKPDDSSSEFETWRSSRDPPDVRDGYELTGSKALGWLPAGSCVQKLEEKHVRNARSGAVEKRVKISWHTPPGLLLPKQEKWVKQVSAEGAVMLAEPQPWVDVAQAMKVCSPASATTLGSKTGPHPGLRHVTEAAMAGAEPQYGTGVPTPSTPVEAEGFADPELDRETATASVCVSWNTVGQVPLDFEVQWGYRWIGDWLTAKPRKAASGPNGKAEVMIRQAAEPDGRNRSQWKAVIVVGRCCLARGEVAMEESFVVRVRALGATGWGEWSPRSSTIRPRVLENSPPGAMAAAGQWVAGAARNVMAAGRYDGGRAEAGAGQLERQGGGRGRSYHGRDMGGR